MPNDHFNVSNLFSSGELGPELTGLTFVLCDCVSLALGLVYTESEGRLFAKGGGPCKRMSGLRTPARGTA